MVLRLTLYKDYRVSTFVTLLCRLLVCVRIRIKHVYFLLIKHTEELKNKQKKQEHAQSQALNIGINDEKLLIVCSV